MSQRPLIKPTGWASEARYNSGTYAGHPTKLRPSATTQQYGIQPLVRPGATELNYVMHSADTLLAQFQWHGVTTFRKPVDLTDQILGVHRPPLGGVILVTDSAAGSIRWLTPGQGEVKALSHTHEVSDVCTLTNATFEGGPGEFLALARYNAARITVLGVDRIWPHEPVFGDISGAVGHDLTNLGAGDLRCCWDEHHQKIHVATSTRVGSVTWNDDFHAGETALTSPFSGSFGSVLPVSSPHGTTIVLGTTRLLRSTDGGVTWTEGPRYRFDFISPNGPTGETISVWWSECQARWYLLTYTTSPVGFDLWQSTDQGETWAWSADLADVLGGIYNVCGAGPNRTRATRIRQFVIFPVSSSTSSVRGLLIFDESNATASVIPFGNTGITYIGEAGGQLVLQTADDQVFTSIGSSMPVPLRKLP